MTRYFEYGDEAVEYLKARDAKLARAIEAVGHVHREMDDPDLFCSVVHCIVGQQVSTAAQATVWARLREALGEVSPEAVNGTPIEELQACGMTFKKAGYIKGFAEKVAAGEFDLAAVERMDDAEAVKALSSLPGIGEWTAEMLLLFCLGRPDVLSFGDLAIHRGMRMVYHHRKVTREMFEKYRRRYSPYGSVASLYLWAVSHMDVPGYDRDYAPKTTSGNRPQRAVSCRAQRAGAQ
ncbi:MAG: DNA-3-methyladenine glycosylase 2 family protein [Eggerthellaceae bacterium]|nr:DNA-3-methyladenine glycosylase 2 family protein [Eggerthellaceae bacterium]